MTHHHRQLLATLGLASLLATCVVRAGESKHDSQALEQLTRKLGSAEFAEREAAERGLDVAGAEALPALKRAAESDDAEIRRRAECLIDQIEKRIETARILKPRTVRLNYREMPLGEAVADFSQKTGILLQLGGDANNRGRVKEELLNRRISLDTGEVGIWQAFDKLCQTAGLVEQHLVQSKSTARGEVQVEINPGGNAAFRRNLVIAASQPAMPQSKVILVEGEAPILPACNTGPVRIRALPSRFIASTSTAGERDFALEASADSSLNWISFDNLRIDKAIDEHGQALLPQYNFPAASPFGIAEEIVWIDAANGISNANAAPYRILSGRLKLGAERSIVLRELSGTISAQVQTPAEPLLTMEKVLSAAGKTVRGDDGYVMEIRDVSHADNGELTVRVAVQQPLNALTINGQLRGNRGFRGRMVSSSSGSGGPTNPVLIDEEGKTLPVLRHQSSTTHLGEVLSQETTLVCRVPKSRAESARLVFSGPRIVVIQVPFTLKDVPLK